jgi:integrase
MATIETRLAEDGTKTFRVKVRIKGQRPQQASFARLTDAKRWAQSTEAAMREGRYFKVQEARRKTLTDLIDRYIRDVLPQRPKNASNTSRHLLWWKSQLGYRLLADIQPTHIAEFRDQLLSTPTDRGGRRANATVQRYLAAISHAYNIAIKDWGWVDENPVAKISKPRAARGRERFLSDEERDRLLSACKASRSQFLYTVVVLAISTGMRRGEIMGLRWKQVDLPNSCLRLSETKNDTSRSIPLASLALSLMTQLSKVRRIDSELVFYGKDKTQPIDLKKPWETALRKAGIDDFRFHDLRHTAASYLAMDGATTMEIAAVLGHKTLQMVKRYSHLASSHTAHVVTSMNDKIFGAARA